MLITFLLVLVVIALSGFRVTKEYKRAVVFRLGRNTGIRGPGVYYLLPFIESGNILDTRTQTVSIQQQETITKDSVTIKVDAVLWYRIADPELAIIRVADYKQAVYQIAQTSLRNITGQHNLDEVLKDRDAINEKLEHIVDQATAPWGIKIELVEMKDVEIPESMQRAMAREAEAMREKRARIIKAEAELESSAKLTTAARLIAENPVALELRRMQMLSEIGAENNTTTVIMMPAEFLQLARNFSESLGGGAQTGTVLKPKVSPVEQLNEKAATPELPPDSNDDIALKAP
jgi:regulator of protease activity HflC (stomatin/prohibitin superfamily)